MTDDGVIHFVPLSWVSLALGLVMWEVLSYVLALSLGLFLTGLAPGYDDIHHGIHSHWWTS